MAVSHFKHVVARRAKPDEAIARLHETSVYKEISSG
jgi:hypothetical protein